MGFTKISIIVCIDNVKEKYLGECLNHLFVQSLQEIEIICVGDKSVVGIEVFLNRFLERDQRIKAIFVDNGKKANIWNKGLENASGEYILFWQNVISFPQNGLEVLYDRAKKNNADVVLFRHQKWVVEKKQYQAERKYFSYELMQKEVFSNEEFLGQVNNFISHGIESKMFCNKFLKENELQFYETDAYEEFAFLMLSFYMAGRLTYEERVIADIKINLIKRKWHIQNPTAFLGVFEKIYDELRVRNVYTKVDKKFSELFVNECYGNLDNNFDNEGKLAICRKIIELSCKYPDIEKIAYECCADLLKVERIFEGSKQAILWYEKKHAPLRKINTQQVEKNQLLHSPKVSVIIPVYNVELYLKECLDSVINQSLTDIEIICVNDGSTDQSLEILLEYKEEKRISIYSQENAGVSAARNLGVKQAKGQYIYFMDSDDKLVPDALEKLFKSADEQKLDVIYCDAWSFAETEEFEQRAEEYGRSYARGRHYSGVWSGPALMKEMLLHGEYRVPVWMQMIRKEYLIENEIWFCEGILHEDNAFTFEVMIRAERVSHVHEKLFFRRVRKGSIMTNTVVFENVYGYFYCFLNMCEVTASIKLMDDEKKAVGDLLRQLLNNIREKYNVLEIGQKQAVLGIPESERFSFEFLILDYDSKNQMLKLKVKQIQELNENNRKLNQEKIECDQKIQELNKQIQILIMEKKNYDKEIEELNEIVRLMKQEKVECDEKIQELNGNNQVLTQEKVERDEKIQELSIRNRLLIQKKSDLDKIIKELNESKKVLIQEKIESNEKIQELDQKTKKLEQQMKKQKKRRTAKIKNMKKTMRRQEKELIELREKTESMTYKVGTVIMYLPSLIKNKLSKLLKKLKKN